MSSLLTKTPIYIYICLDNASCSATQRSPHVVKFQKRTRLIKSNNSLSENNLSMQNQQQNRKFVKGLKKHKSKTVQDLSVSSSIWSAQDNFIQSKDSVKSDGSNASLAIELTKNTSGTLRGYTSSPTVNNLNKIHSSIGSNTTGGTSENYFVF